MRYVQVHQDVVQREQLLSTIHFDKESYSDVNFDLYADRDPGSDEQIDPSNITEMPLPATLRRYQEYVSATHDQYQQGRYRKKTMLRFAPINFSFI